MSCQRSGARSANCYLLFQITKRNNERINEWQEWHNQPKASLCISHLVFQMFRGSTVIILQGLIIMKVKIIIAYHQNLYDTIIALKSSFETIYITPKTTKKIPVEIPHKMITTYSFLKKFKVLNLNFIMPPWLIWKNISRDDDYVIVKHVASAANLWIYIVCRVKGVKCIINVQKFHKINSALIKSALKLIILFIGKKTPIFSSTKEGAKDAGNYFKNVHYIPQCINSNRFMQKSFAERGNSLSLICVSKYVKRKNISYLVDAIDGSVKKYPKTKFSLKVIGKFLSKNSNGQKVYDEIVSSIQKKKLSENISLLQSTPNNRMNAHYNKADIFVFPASDKPHGYALCEAMACGLPILCSSEIGAKSDIEINKNGVIFKPKDATAIIEAISQFMENGLPNWEKISLFGNKSRELIEKNNSPSTFLQKFGAMIKGE